MGIFGNKDGSPSSIVDSCCDVDDTTDGIPPVDCFVDLTMSPAANPGVIIPIAAGHRYIVTNVTGPIDPGWINLPLGLQEHDIIERDFQNLNWLLSLDVSAEEDENTLIVKVICRNNYLYWWNCTDWVEISPCNFGGYLHIEDLCVTSNGQTVFVLTNTVQNPERTIFKVNGIPATYTADYLINGTVLTWNDNNFQLETTDCLEIMYC